MVICFPSVSAGPLHTNFFRPVAYQSTSSLSFSVDLPQSRPQVLRQGPYLAEETALAQQHMSNWLMDC